MDINFLDSTITKETLNNNLSIKHDLYKIQINITYTKPK